MRTGAELMRATKPFSKEIPWRSWYGLLSSIAVHGLLIAGLVLITPWWGKAAIGVLMGLSIVRLFVIYHDYCHGAIFRKSFLGKAIMTVIGWYTIAVPSVWRESHNYHHANNSKLTGSSIGSYPIVSVPVWRVLKDKQRRQIKMVRHPLFILGGIVTLFTLGMGVSPFMRDKKQHWTAPVAAVVWWTTFAVVSLAFGWQYGVFGVLLPGLVSSAAGGYLFYAQHNFPEARFRGRRQWDYQAAALESSSMFDMSAPMHWFTGNIGYHHVHHLNHTIPWYRLPEAYNAIPELQNPGRTSWAIKDIVACFKCSVWDPEKGRMVTFAEADASRQQDAIAAK